MIKLFQDSQGSQYARMEIVFFEKIENPNIRDKQRLITRFENTLAAMVRANFIEPKEYAKISEVVETYYTDEEIRRMSEQ